MTEDNLLVLPLRQAEELQRVGGKAVNLAKLIQAGLPVPGGFVVTTQAYRDGGGKNISDELAQQIRAALEPLSGKQVAVRSSATAEDLSGASMAGQYDTFLNLQTPEEVIDAVQKCWASVHSSRTEAYLAEHNIAIDDVAMAVVVQEQVAADAAGVLFTADPQSGIRDQMLIEACWGLGEALVSGEVQPDVIRLNSKDTEVLGYDVADKQQALYPGSEKLEPVKAELRQRACLRFEHIEQLSRWGQRAEQHFGTPQDIEWALAGDEIFILQSRAITTLAETDTYQRLLSGIRDDLSEKVAAGQGPWVRHNLGETLPHPTPLTWSILAPFMSGTGGFGKMHEKLGFQPGPAVADQSFLQRIAGEVYMDCSLMTEMFSENYPFAYDPELLRNDPDAAQSAPTLSRGSLKERGQAAQLAQAAAARVDELAVDLDKTFDKEFIPELTAWVQAQQDTDLSALSDSDLGAHWDKQRANVLDEFGEMAFLPSMVAAVAVEKLDHVLNEVLWDEDTVELKSTLSVSTLPDRTTAGTIDLQKLPPEEWLKTYGHRATAEFDLASPRWKEQPDIISTLKKQAGDHSLSDHHQQRVKAAETCLKRLQEKLNAEEYAAVSAASDLVQRYLRFREDGKFYLMLAYAELRETALEIGKRLNIGDDVFYLESHELIEALQSGFVPQDRIRTRQLEYQVEPRIRTPHVIEADDIPQLGQAPEQTGGSVWSAHSVSSGSASGNARIIRDPSQSETFQDGDILVCPSTDPSWTPLFTRASALVLERGGSLSHGAVVAREMGLPAVVLDGATDLVLDGETLTVDANAGKIFRADAESASTASLITPALIPPPPGQKEARSNQLGLIAALFWGVVLAAIFLLPPQLLHDRCFALLDFLCWPLIRAFGMIGAVAAIASLFGLIPILGQKWLTDNARLLEAKRRSSKLRKAAAQLPADDPQRAEMEALARPVTMRILKASMVPLALILGPMIMVFMWFPARVDPASWNTDPGRTVSIVAQISGECLKPVSIAVPPPLQLYSEAVQVLPDIRTELEELQAEWKGGSDLSDLPWEVQSAGDHTRMTMLASLNAYLRADIPPQTLSWFIEVPETATGRFPVELKVGDQIVSTFDLVFGKEVPPAPAAFLEISPEVIALDIKYPRPLQIGTFYTIPGTKKDVGWLGIYLLLYLPVMFGAKAALKVP